MNYRPLTSEEIALLESQHCRCPDWSQLEVSPRFSPQFIRNVYFSGTIRLGCFEREITLAGGLSCHAGIENAVVHHCAVADNVFIRNVGHLANYRIGENSIVENVDTLVVNGKTAFGNGTRVNAVNEQGGREVAVYNELTAQIAYMLCIYRHRPRCVEALSQMIDQYAEQQSDTMGTIGSNVHIAHCGVLRNMNFGDHCLVEGAQKLSEGTVNSSELAPSHILHGVIASHFVMAQGAILADNAIVDHCFVGQGAKLDKGFAAEHSLFFANSEGLRGEACAVFAGPFTVTHHKSTLLIAELCSFLNAGSGSNASNHAYKLGPVHQGILERGCKTASNSFLLLPAKIGAFTAVVGQHVKHSDTSAFPFSYLIENAGESVLAPGANLRSVGVVRDAKKWAQRDYRTAAHKLDLVNFELLSPYTVHKMIRGRQLLLELEKSAPAEAEVYRYSNAIIRRSALLKGIKYYEMGITHFLGDVLVQRLKNKCFESNQELRQLLALDNPVGAGAWVDIAGMLAPQSEIERLLNEVESGALATLSDIAARLETIHLNYHHYEWTWVADVLQRIFSAPMSEFTTEKLAQCVAQWQKSVTEWKDLLCADAEKEFAAEAQTGFGADGNGETQAADFEQVRGDFGSHPFVVEIKRSAEQKMQSMTTHK